MKKMLILGELETTNLGDQLIVDSVTKNIRAALPDTNINVVPLNVRGGQCYRIVGKVLRGIGMVWFKEFEKMVFKRRLSKCLPCQCVVFPGGELFLPYFQDKIQAAVEWAAEHGVSVYFYAIGIGKMTKENKQCLEHILQESCVKYISLRDGYDFFNKKIPIHGTYDPVLGIENVVDQTEHFLGIGIIDSKVLQSYCGIDEILYEERIVEFVREQQKKGTVALFTSGATGDNYFLEKLQREYSLVSDELVFIPKSVQEWLKIYMYFDCVVSFRLHSLIAAYVSGIPIYGIAWDNKVNHLFEVIGEPDKVVDIEDFVINEREICVDNYKLNLERKREIRNKIKHDFDAMINEIKGIL